MDLNQNAQISPTPSKASIWSSAVAIFGLEEEDSDKDDCVSNSSLTSLALSLSALPSPPAVGPSSEGETPTETPDPLIAIPPPVSKLNGHASQPACSSRSDDGESVEEMKASLKRASVSKPETLDPTAFDPFGFYASYTGLTPLNAIGLEDEDMPPSTSITPKKRPRLHVSTEPLPGDSEESYLGHLYRQFSSPPSRRVHRRRLSSPRQPASAQPAPDEDDDEDGLKDPVVEIRID